VVWLAVGVLVICGTGNRKVNVQGRGREEGGYPPTPKVGPQGNTREPEGKPSPGQER